MRAELFLTNYRPVPLTEYAVFKGCVYAKVRSTAHDSQSCLHIVNTATPMLALGLFVSCVQPAASHMMQGSMPSMLCLCFLLYIPTQSADKEEHVQNPIYQILSPFKPSA